eukprot:sb/3473673/
MGTAGTWKSLLSRCVYPTVGGLKQHALHKLIGGWPCYGLRRSGGRAGAPNKRVRCDLYYFRTFILQTQQSQTNKPGGGRYRYPTYRICDYRPTRFSFRRTYLPYHNVSPTYFSFHSWTRFTLGLFWNGKILCDPIFRSTPTPSLNSHS